MNIFDNAPTTLPEKLITGDSWFWTEDTLSVSYPPVEYTLVYLFSNLDDGTSFTITPDKVDGNYQVTELDTDTLNYTDGKYNVTTQMTRLSDGLKASLYSKIIKLVPSSLEQSYNQRVLTAIRATLEKTASKEQMQYSISGMQLIRRSPEQLMKLEQEFARRVQRERDEWMRENGQTVATGKTRVVMGA